MTEALITDLFIKPAKGAPMLPQGELRCVRGLGIEGDVNISRQSPRQILICEKAHLDPLGIKPGDLRENVVVELSDGLLRPGDALIGSDGLAIQFTFYCEPCKRIAGACPDFRSTMTKRGVLGVIASGGTLKAGAKLSVNRGAYQPLGETPFERFLSFTRKVPSGKVVSYRELVIGMGVADSFYRACPGYVAKASAGLAPVHRIVDTSGALLDGIPDQRRLLEQEGVRFDPDFLEILPDEQSRVDLDKYTWRPAHVDW